ncbi:MAG: IclR family transcriptional regulator [Geodermatophilaceae bacterium]|nr:IclR family transcriptional regulator [Geodermatophilaceae bacterium]
MPQYPIESVDNALRVLVLLGQRPQLRLTDVSQYLGVASSTAHRLLAMLSYRGLVRQNQTTRSYEPGPSLDQLAYGLLRRLDVRSRARPILEKLNAELEETVHLGRLEGGDVHFIDSIESTRALRVVNRLGRSMPAHCTSTGKALLATLSEPELLAVYPDEGLVQLTRYSIGTRTALIAALAEIRRRGFATSQQESEEGVQSLAVALRAVRSPRLALCASVPISRMNASARKAIRDHLIEAAEAIDALLP